MGEKRERGHRERCDTHTDFLQPRRVHVVYEEERPGDKINLPSDRVCQYIKQKSERGRVGEGVHRRLLVAWVNGATDRDCEGDGTDQFCIEMITEAADDDNDVQLTICNATPRMD